MKSKIYGILLFIEAGAMLFTALVAWYYHVRVGDNDVEAFLLTAAITGLAGLVLFLFGQRKNRKSLSLGDSFQVVSLSWVLFSAFGMLPFLLTGTVDNIADAFFETMSGVTTSGGTILEHVGEQPHGVLFWRSIIQWIGGLGIVVFTLAFIPAVARSSKKMSLFAAESSGISVEKLSPKLQTTAIILWVIYIVLTLLCILCYWLGPMNLFDAVCYTMTTMSTGGFGNQPESIGYFHSHYLEYVCSIFMILASSNFSMYYFFVARKWSNIFKNEEFRTYFVVVFVMVLFYCGLFYVAPHIKGVTQAQLDSYPKTLDDTVRTSLFIVTDLLSSTGFQPENCNYDLWGILFVIPTLTLMIIGGCSGSTCGGIKMVRVIVIVKYIRNAINELIHPTGMFSIKLSGQTVEDTTVRRVCSFFSLLIILYLFNLVALSATGMSLSDATSTFIACFSNHGSASGTAGPIGNYHPFHAVAKWILSFDMLVGRLEIFTVLMLFSGAFRKPFRA